MVLSGNNTYSGTTTITNGIVNVQSNTALGLGLGLTTSNTTIGAGAALELQTSGSGLTITDELITNASVGFDGVTATSTPLTAVGATVIGTGGIRNISGNNTLQSSAVLQPGALITSATGPSIGVDSGSTLTVNGVVAMAAVNTYKVGTGTLVLGGGTVNSGTGTFYLNEGTVQLNKTVAVNALTENVVIGDNRGGADSDVLQYGPALAGTASVSDIVDEIGAVTVTVQSSGKLDLTTYNQSDSIGALNLVEGITSSADVEVNNANILTLGGNVTVFVQGGTTSASPAALIAGGNLSLGGAARTFQISRGEAPTDLQITAVVSGSGGGVLTKTYPGTLENENEILALVTVGEGTYLIDPSAQSVGNITVSAGGVLTGTGTVVGNVTAGSPTTTAAIGGTIAPGNANGTSYGILTVDGNVNFLDGSVFEEYINGGVAGISYDQLDVNGSGFFTTIATPSIFGGAKLSATLNSVPPSGTVLVLIQQTSGNVQGAFANATANQVIILKGPTVAAKSFTSTYPAGQFVLNAVVNTDVWTGADVGVDSHWSDPLNWQSDTVPSPGDNLVFNIVGVGTDPTAINDLAAGTYYSSITIGATSGSYTLSGNSILLNSPSGGVFNTGGSNTISLPISTGSNPQTFNSTSGNLIINGAVTLGTGGSLTVSASSGAAVNFTSSGTIDGAQSVATSGAGNVAFNGAIGSITPVSSLTTANTGSLTLASGSVTTTGAQNYTTATTLGGSTLALTSTAGGNITFGSSVSGAVALTITTAGTGTFNGPVGTGTPLTSVSTGTSGTFDINGGSVSTSGVQAYNEPVLLSANTVLTSSGTVAAGNITLANTVNSTAGTFSLTVNSAGTTFFDGVVGGVASLASVATDSAGSTDINTTGITTTGADLQRSGHFGFGQRQHDLDVDCRRQYHAGRHRQ